MNIKLSNLLKYHFPETIGFLAWMLLLCFWLPFSPFAISWVHLIILAAQLWMIPLAWKSMNLPEKSYEVLPLFSMPLVLAFLLEQGVLSSLFALPWLGFTTWLAINQLFTFHKKFNASDYCQLAAFLFLPVGAAWLFADRLGFQPLGFEPVIVTLTAAHFHYAGFFLPLLASQVIKHFDKKTGKIVTLGIILGVGLVAIGITTTHFNLPSFIEIIAVTTMALAGGTVGILHLILGWKNRKAIFGGLWMLAGIALVIGMGLALLYGWRTVFPLSFLSIPWMYAVHGTLNSMGFALLGVLGWYFSFNTYN